MFKNGGVLREIAFQLWQETKDAEEAWAGRCVQQLHRASRA